MKIKGHKLRFILWGSACLAGILCGYVWLFIPLTAVVLVFVTENLEKTDREILFLFSLLLTIGYQIKLFSFTFFDQALVLYQENKSLLHWFLIGHIHAIRMLIAYPGAMLAEFFGLNINQGFSIYVCAVFEAMLVLILRTLKEMEKRNIYSGMAAMCFLSALAYVMNGRIVFAFVAAEILIYVDVLHKKGKLSTWKLYLSTGLAIVLSMVSSGTMLLLVFYVLVESFFRIRYLSGRKQTQNYRRSLMAILTPMILFLTPYLWRMLKKNIDFYGGGWEGLLGILQHGIGGYIYEADILYLSMLILAGFLVAAGNMILFWRNVYKTGNHYIALYLLVNLSLYGMFVGISTGLLILIPVFLLACVKMGRKRYIRLS